MRSRLCLKKNNSKLQRKQSCQKLPPVGSTVIDFFGTARGREATEETAGDQSKWKDLVRKESASEVDVLLVLGQLLLADDGALPSSIIQSSSAADLPQTCIRDAKVCLGRQAEEGVKHLEMWGCTRHAG
jgi:hypothetical protein